MKKFKILKNFINYITIGEVSTEVEYYLDNEKIHKCAKNGNEVYLNIDVEKRKWKEIFN